MVISFRNKNIIISSNNRLGNSDKYSEFRSICYINYQDIYILQ